MRIGRIRKPRAELEKKLAEALEQQLGTSDALLDLGPLSSITPVLSGLHYRDARI